MEIKKIEGKELRAMNGVLALFLIILGALATIAVFVLGCVSTEIWELPTGLEVAMIVIGMLGIVVFSVMSAGFKIVHPNEAKVFTLFGKYHGTISRSGFFYINPFSVAMAPSDKDKDSEAATKGKATLGQQNITLSASPRRSVSLKTQTLNNDKQKVNDVLGNPIVIGAIVIWRVVDPTQAVFAVENYKEYLSVQTDSIVRNTARLYPYDIFDDDDDNDGVKAEKSLRGSSLEIADSMKNELQQRVKDAGLEIEEVRITHLAYSEEIAAAMLQRQQAAAIIAARQKIVDGAVGMVKMAIDKLSEDEVVVLDDERKAVMVSNLLVVLCGNKDAQPVVNSGTLY